MRVVAKSGAGLCCAVVWAALSALAGAQQIPLQALVNPSTVVTKDGRPVRFAVHGFIEFDSLGELFPYVESQVKRWKNNGGLDEAGRQRLAHALLREGVESRVISMVDERPLETLMTHTEEELRQALAQVKDVAPAGYAEAFVAVQQKWKRSLNCWSASPSIPGRVLSNWYPIEEGITLYGDVYDSTEHFWQAVKYHPNVTVADLTSLIAMLEGKEWSAWLKRLDDDPKLYLPNAYAVEFLRFNLKPDRLRWFREQLSGNGLSPNEKARSAQQRGKTSFRFTALQEKVLWGDLADLFHLIYAFSPGSDATRDALAEHHFDGIYLGERKMGFISDEFRSQMLEIWRVKYLQMPRFREVISGIPMEVRLEHFLNDGDSPDIPIPVYVGYLNQIRELAHSSQ